MCTISTCAEIISSRLGTHSQEPPVGSKSECAEQVEQRGQWTQDVLASEHKDGLSTVMGVGGLPTKRCRRGEASGRQDGGGVEGPSRAPRSIVSKRRFDMRGLQTLLRC